MVGSFSAPPPKGEVGLAPLADKLVEYRAVALKTNPPRSDIFKASAGCKEVAIALRAAADHAAKLEESKGTPITIARIKQIQNIRIQAHATASTVRLS